MSRYTGPRVRVMRALGVELPGLSRKSTENRPNPPGQHGASAARRRKSDYGVALIEKQKLRYNYGVKESQLRKLMVQARHTHGSSGSILLQLLESRLDNAVFRAGIAPTLIAARQLVSHRHIMVNGRIANIPSIRLRAGDEIQLRERSRNIPMVVENLANPALSRPEWLSWDEQNYKAKLTRLPEADEVPFPIDIQLVVQYYAMLV
jgi:small subunit ribosomal protein S4